MSDEHASLVFKIRSNLRSVRILKPEAPKICELIFDFLVSFPAELALRLDLGLVVNFLRHGMAFVLDGVIWCSVANACTRNFLDLIHNWSRLDHLAEMF